MTNPAAQVLKREVGAGLAVAHRETGLDMVTRVARRRVPDVHVQGHTSHARQEEGLSVGVHPVTVTVGQRRPDLATEHLGQDSIHVA
jgi:hypothetical protein